MFISAPDFWSPSFGIDEFQLGLDRPAQINTSPWDGTRRVMAQPWHGKWRASVKLLPIVGDANIRAVRSFFARCRGSTNTFRIFATEAAQNGNSGVTALVAAAANATTLRLAGYATPLLDGQFVTVNGQLLQLTANQAGDQISFEPPLRAAVALGTTVVTSRPYGLFYLGNSYAGWSLRGPGVVYGITFDVEEAVLEADGVAPTEAVPTNTVLPTITGNPYVGALLSASAGTWTEAPTAYAFQWYADAVAIAGATGTTYSPVQGDVGKTIKVGVVATNAYGSGAQAFSADSAAIDSYAIFANFKTQTYRRLGNASALSALPGYSFSRTGIQGALAADGSAAFFAANVPAINSNGHHPFVAVTNLLLQSQTLDHASWNKAGAAVTANSDAAPDGTSTADTLKEDASVSASHSEWQDFGTLAASTTYTASVLVKPLASGSARNLRLSLGDTTGANGVQATIDPSTGAVSGLTAFGTGWTAVSAQSSQAGSGYWRVAIVVTTPGVAPSARLRMFLLNGSASFYTGDNVSGLYLWQGQVVAGNFPLGGPLVATTTATAALGPSDLEIGASLPAGDFIIWTALTLPAVPAANIFPFSLSTAGAGSSSELLNLIIGSTGSLSMACTAAGVVQSIPAALANIVTGSGRVIVGVRRKAGVYSLFAKKADGSQTIGADAASTGAVPACAAIEVGAQYNGASQVNGRVEGLYQQNGTFDDAAIAAILAAA